ncbi:FtsQ-type POTRA domain-containing protein [Streptomyces sp. A3M-1-3]|uniref:cell division protein FtsQ/DivIB n=1 Tax=Streptomyces sp. A3M-1-3 TaxID=2962044 RepID=UPI0020B78394|nr:FtsQ-type POTRA domain-containing protein [Streptomyces sp. A3M-1-3]MCP3817352.1 FtsQ-type POTRA domain-containing protein [Streptomyces sp. A3M-1-3]
MAGATTAQRGEREALKAGPPRRPGRPRRRLGFRGRRLLVLAVIAAIFGGTFGTWVLYGSTWLRVERVSASGTEVLSPGEVREAADVPLGAPLISVDTDAIESRLRSRLPRIDSVDVVRAWPHGIGLKVVERKPALLIEKGAKFIEVDAEGVRFATVPNAPKGVPLLELTADQSPSLRRFDTDRLVIEAVLVTGGLPGEFAEDLRVIKVRSYDSISLELSGDRTVVWGSGERTEAKVRAITALMKAAPKARHFDVSTPTAPAVSRS